MAEARFLEKLLDGAGVTWVPLDRVAKIKHGKDWKNLNAGDVPVYGSGGIMGYVDTYSYDKPAVLIPRKGSITNVFGDVLDNYPMFFLTHCLTCIS